MKNLNCPEHIINEHHSKKLPFTPVDPVDDEPHLPFDAANPKSVMHKADSRDAVVKDDIGVDPRAFKTSMFKNSIAVSDCKIL